MLSFSPRDVLDEILDLVESVSEGFPTYSYITERIRIVSVLFPFGQVVSARVVPTRFLGLVVSAVLGRVVSALFHWWVVLVRFWGSFRADLFI